MMSFDDFYRRLKNEKDSDIGDRLSKMQKIS
jgi:hypothetical protein